MSATTQSTTPATLPAGVTLALDVVGSAAAPTTGDGIPYSKLDIGAAGASSPVTAANPLPVSIAGTVTTNTGLTQPLTDAQIRASALPVSGAFFQATQPVSIAATVTTDPSDRAARLLGHVTVDNASIPVTGTFWQTTQPISGSVGITGSVVVAGPLTDTQLRASAVPVSNAALPLPSNAAQETGGALATIATASALQGTAANQATANTALASVVAFNQTLLTDLLQGILMELRINNTLLQSGLNVRDDLDAFRADPYYNQ